MAEQTTEQAIAEIWQLFKETDARLDRRFAETSAEIAKTNTEVARTSAEVAKTTASINKLEGLFGNQWGRLVEALVQPGVLKLFQQRGHDVHQLHQRSKTTVNGSTMEIDIILVDGDEVVLVEVKTNLTVENVNEFLEDLGEFTNFFPNYRTFRIYGAVAGLEIPNDVARYAYKRGLYVVNISGNDLVEIANDEKFRPKDFQPN